MTHDDLGRGGQSGVATSDTSLPTMVRLRGLTKRFGDLTVVDGVDLDVTTGGVLAIIGPSGAGKSTLLRCVNLLEMPTQGEVEVDGCRVDAARKVSRREIEAIRRKTGMVFQSFNLFPHLTVLENVSFAQRRVLGRSRTEADERSRELLVRVGLSDKLQTYPARCSGGQQQRAAIARALALNPQVMLFDEPTSALDPEVGYEVLMVMRQLVADGMTMLVATHEMTFAKEVADQVAVMADGCIIEQGASRDVIESPTQPRTQKFLRKVVDR
jgi:polar amino acid transport system ATP-binding protein